jgi:predicted DNA-binding protein
MGNRKEPGRTVKSTITPDAYLKLEILSERTGKPIFRLVKEAVEDYVSDVRPEYRHSTSNIPEARTEG